jgi:hypothetical protein
MPWRCFPKTIDRLGRPPVIDLKISVSPGHLLALVDSLHSGTLNDAQQGTMQALRIAILVLVES